MHQQVRLQVTKTSTDDSGAMPVEESLIGILSLLQGTNLRSAGRVNPDAIGGGEFVFSVQHDDGDDTADSNACDVLKAENYDAEVYRVRDFKLEHKEGSLLKCIQRVEREMNEPVIEVYVGAAEANGKVPVQLVTRSMLNR